MMRRRYKFLVLSLAFLSWRSSDAQYQYHAAIKPVDSSQFYAIDITPELSSYLSFSFNDLRIQDKDQKQVPYIIRSKWANSFSLDYRFLKIVSSTVSDSNQSVILENASKDKIAEIGLLLKNAAVSRTINISGSDDNSRWFTIAEDVSLVNNYLPSKDEYVENISIPLTSYRYLKVIINNKKHDPLNIISAGYSHMSEYRIDPEYIENGSLTFTQKDSSDKNSYILVTQDKPYQFDRIDIKLKAPKFYKREAEVIIEGNINSYIISSDTLVHFSFPGSKALKYYIKIYNGDNPAIKIVDVRSLQLKRQIAVWLDKKMSYEMLLINSNAQSPNYDLADFKDSIPVILPVAEVDQIIAYPAAALNEKTSKFNTRNLVWPAIIVAVLILGLLTFKLTKEVVKK
jgi:hypothetical protein